MSEKNGKKTMNDLRQILLCEIDDVRGGKSPVTRGQTIAKLANAVIASVNSELQFRKYLHNMGHEVEKNPIALVN